MFLELHENIKSLRIARGWSQQFLADKTGYKDRSSIAKIESGKVDLSRSKIAEFAKLFDVTPAFLLGCVEKTAVPKDDGLSPLEAQLMELIRRLTDDQKRMLLAQIELLLSKQG